MVELKNLEGLWKIFTIEKKNELRKHCRDVVVYLSDFSQLVLTCETGFMPLGHQTHYRDYLPEHLRSSTSALQSLHENGVGPLNDEEQKTVRKITQLLTQRRYLVGHIFYHPDFTRWHFFYFDQRDIEESESNHWEYGSHIHVINWLWPGLSAQDLWTKFVTGNTPPSGSFHIKFIRGQD
jgi:hypothetical protein